MNFGLNKIDTDIRRKLQEETKDGKIHRKGEVFIQKDEEDNRDKNFDNILNNEKYKKEHNDKKVINEEVLEVKVQVKTTIDSNKDLRGSFLDVKK